MAWGHDMACPHSMSAGNPCSESRRFLAKVRGLVGRWGVVSDRWGAPICHIRPATCRRGQADEQPPGSLGKRFDLKCRD